VLPLCCDQKNGRLLGGQCQQGCVKQSEQEARSWTRQFSKSDALFISVKPYEHLKDDLAGSTAFKTLLSCDLLHGCIRWCFHPCDARAALGI
jgi:hypothetical protein